MALYWGVLPFTLLGLVLGGVNLAFGLHNPITIGMTVGCALFSVVLIWRLWLNSRALGWAGPLPGVARLMLVWLPLTGLGLIGLALVAMGGFWILIGLIAEPGVDQEQISRSALVSGGVAIVIGLLANWPLLHLIRRRPVSVEPSPEA